MGIQTTIRKCFTVGLLAVGMAGFALADHGADDGQADDRGRNRGNDKSATTTAASSSTTETRLRTRLSGPNIGGVAPQGNAEFRSNPSRGRSSLKVQAEHVNLPAGTQLAVTLNSQSVGTITLDAFGFGELDLDSQDGDTVPTVQKGTTVAVSNGGTGILIGIF